MRYPLWLVVVALVLGFTINTGATWFTAEASGAQAPTVLSGEDIGFRVESHNGTTPIGALVIRVDGKWVEPQFAGGPKPVK